MRKRYRKDVSFDFPLVQCNLGVLCRKKSYPELYLALIGVYYIFLWSTKKFRHNILSFIIEITLLGAAIIKEDDKMSQTIVQTIEHVTQEAYQCIEGFGLASTVSAVPLPAGCWKTAYHWIQ